MLTKEKLEKLEIGIKKLAFLLEDIETKGNTNDKIVMARGVIKKLDKLIRENEREKTEDEKKIDELQALIEQAQKLAYELLQDGILPDTKDVRHGKNLLSLLHWCYVECHYPTGTHRPW